MVDRENEYAAGIGLSARFASEQDVMAVAGATVELVSRQVRLGEPATMLELAPVVERLLFGLLSPS